MKRWLIACTPVALIAFLAISTDPPAGVRGATATPTPVAAPYATPSPGPQPPVITVPNPGPQPPTITGPNPGPQPPGNRPPPGPPTADEERLRRDFGAYLNELRDAISTAKQVPQMRDALGRAGVDPVAMLGVAQQQVAAFSGDDLAAMQKAFGQDPSWRQRPAILKAKFANLARLRNQPPGPPGPPGPTGAVTQYSHFQAATRASLQTTAPALVLCSATSRP